MNKVLNTHINEDKEIGATRHIKPCRSTSPVFWSIGCALTLVFLLLRVPSLFSTVIVRMHQLPEVQELNDPALVEAATAFAFYLGIVFNVIGIVLYFSLASVVETRLFSAVKITFKTASLGFLGCCTLFCIIPGQLYALIFKVTSPKDLWGSYLFLFLVAAITLICYRKQWGSLPLAQRGIAVVSAYGCCLVSIFL